MIQISILSGSSPASRKATPLWRGLCQLCARATGTSSRRLSLHCSLETQMQTQSRPLHECILSAHRALTPCIHVQLVASYSNPVRNTACLGKTRTRKGRCAAIQAGSEEEHMEPGAETLAVLGKCISIKAEAPVVLCPPFLPSSSSKCLSHSHTPPLPKSVWVLMPFTIKHHQPAAAHHHHHDVSFPE